MPWIEFIAPFDFKPPEKPCVRIAYRPGMVMFVRRVCADQAIAKGRAVPAERPPSGGFGQVRAVSGGFGRVRAL